MCGIVGIVSQNPVNQLLYDALLMLQHRGQDAAGIVTSEHEKLYMRKDNGLVRDVFRSRHMLRLRGTMGIGHVRYPTAGVSSSAEAQPFYVNSPYGIVLAHNGNLTNAEHLKRDVLVDDLRHINTHSDSEILLNVFAHELQIQNKLRIDEQDLFTAVAGVHRRCRGGYAVVAMIPGFGILGFRDPNGIRPIVYGQRETDAGTDYMIASESVALDTCGFQLITDIAPGEAIFIPMKGSFYTRQCAQQPVLSPCIFEFVYFARPDSIIDNISVHKARSRMGKKLAAKIKRTWPNHDIDVVIPIPDTSRTAALQLANQLSLPYAEGFIKNRYIGRTFIMPGQAIRKRSVRQKLNAINLEFRKKNVLLVDDSIVRGTTSQQIIQMTREAGAKKVYLASAAPPVRYPNVYGIDMPVASELIAHERGEWEIEQALGCDRLIFQDLSDLIEAVQKKNKSLVDRFDTSVFDGHYITGDVSADYLQQLEIARNNRRKEETWLSYDEATLDDTIIDLHNTV
jgi:amidophosphoribosyltransferase